MSTEVATQNTAAVGRPIDSLRGLLEKAAPKLREVAPKHLKVDRVIRLMLSACSRNPKLLECSGESVLQFCMKCSETGLEPIGAGGAWPVPYENRKTGKVEMQFIPDYRGLVNCAKRAECITDAYAEVVRENDAFDCELGLEPRLVHKPDRGDRGALQGAYCIYQLPDGQKRFIYMDAKEITGIRNRSRAAQAGPWVTDESEMWKKTVVRRAMKPFAGASPQLDAAIDADDAATGLHLPGDARRDPIAEPQAKSIPAEAHDLPPADAQPPVQQPASADQQQDNVFEGVLDDVLVKEGKRKDGTPWTKYSLKLGSDLYGTFDKKVGEAAVALKGSGVKVAWKQDGEYKTATAIVAGDLPL